MRQGRIMVFSVLLLGFLVPVNAVERALLDFTTYNENIVQVIDKEQEIYDQVVVNSPELDIRNFGWPDFIFEADDWNLENWKVVLNASSDTAMNRNKSMVKNSPSQQYGNVLGVRLQFQSWPHAFWAKVTLPFFFSHVYLDGRLVSQNDDNDDNGLAIGVLANVGQIKNVRSWFYGLQYDYNYGVRVVDEMGDLSEYGLGSVNYEGWRRLSWNNRNYLDNIDSVSDNPLYPFHFPYLKFDSLTFYKTDGSSDPNFIGYARDVTMEFDYAVLREDQDINDEAIWQILSQRAVDERLIISRRLAEELLTKRQVDRTKAANAAGDDAAAADANAAAVAP